MSVAEEIIIASPEALEEACLSIPAVRALHHAGARVVITAAEQLVPLWETVTEVDEIISHERSARKLAKKIAHFKHSLAWEFGSAAQAFLKAKIPQRLGPPAKKLAQLLTDPLVIEKKAGPVTHRVEYYLLLVEKMGASAFEACNFQGPSASKIEPRSQAALVPGSDFGPASEWALSRFQELAEKMPERDFLVFPSPNRPQPAQALVKALGGRATLAPSDLAAQLSLLAQCDLCVGNDGAIPHLAAHMGVPCLTLFGPNDPAWKRPLGTVHEVVHHLGPCSSCFLAKCPLDHRCLNEISVDEVASLLPPP